MLTTTTAAYKINTSSLGPLRETELVVSELLPGTYSLTVRVTDTNTGQSTEHIQEVVLTDE